MKAKVYNLSGENVAMLDVADELFAQQPSKDSVVQFAATAVLANKRRAIAATKTRGQVRGGGKKPWKQKGTGRARAGSIRSPLWRGGGIIFGPTPARNFFKKVNRNAKRLALGAVLSDRARHEHLAILDSLELGSPKTSELLEKLQMLKSVVKGERVLFITPHRQENLRLAARNLPHVKVAVANNLALLDLLWADTLIILQPALAVLEKTYCRPAAA